MNAVALPSGLVRIWHEGLEVHGCADHGFHVVRRDAPMTVLASYYDPECNAYEALCRWRRQAEQTTRERDEG